MTVPEPFVHTVWFMLDTCFLGVWNSVHARQRVPTWPAPNQNSGAKSLIDFPGWEHHRRVAGARVNSVWPLVGLLEEACRWIPPGFACDISSYNSAVDSYCIAIKNSSCEYNYMLSLTISFTEFQKVGLLLRILDTYTFPSRAFKLLIIVILNSLSDISNICALSLVLMIDVPLWTVFFLNFWCAL